MKYFCPKCKNIVFETGTQDEKGQHWGIDREIQFRLTDKGTVLTCSDKDCPETFRVLFGEEDEIPWFSVLGLLRTD